MKKTIGNGRKIFKVVLHHFVWAFFCLDLKAKYDQEESSGCDCALGYKLKTRNIGLIGALSAGEHYLRGFYVFLWRRS
jgi:hypothetical protein